VIDDRGGVDDENDEHDALQKYVNEAVDYANEDCDDVEADGEDDDGDVDEDYDVDCDAVVVVG
jgi:hypothetical protein